MDNLTHSLTCIALARVGGKRFGPYATALMVLAGNAPDIDVVTRIDSTATYLNYHRGITHSFVAAPVLAAAVVGLFVLGRRIRRSTRPFSLGRAYLVALFGILAGHLFLDWTTNYGTRLLAPFSSRWLAWDAIPIIDLWLLAALIAGLTLPAFFRMIGEEIGAKKKEGCGGAIFAVVFLLAWFGFRGVLHARAVAVVDAHLYQGQEPQSIGAFANLLNPFRWHTVIETAETWETTEVRLLDEFDPTATRVYRKPEATPALEAARRTRTGRIFLDFARYPFGYVESTEDGYRVILRDLRFDYSLNSAKGFVVEVLLGPDLSVRQERFFYRPDFPVR